MKVYIQRIENKDCHDIRMILNVQALTCEDSLVMVYYVDYNDGRTKTETVNTSKYSVRVLE